MKKILMALLALCLMAPVSVDAQDSRALSKVLKKEFKQKKKELKKGKWEIYGSSFSIETALQRHYEKLLLGGEGVSEVQGVASNFNSKNIGHQMAVNNACNNYARRAGSTVRGRIVSDLAADAENIDTEFDKFYAAYESTVEKEIKGEMSESFSIIREVGKDKNSGKPIYEMQTFFIVDENAASRARIRAFEAAKAESEAAQKYAEQVSDFIKEGFEGE